jgi:SOS-response transcriptional repressor LexA
MAQKPLRAIVCEGKAILTTPLQPPGLAAWAEEAMKKLHTLVKDKGHKRAFRLWTAALDPDSESFVARLFQMHETKGACFAAVRATPAGEALRVLLDE